MKKILLFTLFLSSVAAFSQIQETHAPATDSSRDHLDPEAQKPAEYPGGIRQFMTIISQKIRVNRIKRGKGELHSKAKFAVNINGEIEKVTVTGSNEDFNKEVERTINSIKTKWKPATYKGSPVLTWYNLPFVVNFD